MVLSPPGCSQGQSWTAPGTHRPVLPRFSGEETEAQSTGVTGAGPALQLWASDSDLHDGEPLSMWGCRVLGALLRGSFFGGRWVFFLYDPTSDITGWLWAPLPCPCGWHRFCVYSFPLIAMPQHSDRDVSRLPRCIQVPSLLPVVGKAADPGCSQVTTKVASPDRTCRGVQGGLAKPVTVIWGELLTRGRGPHSPS